MSQVENHLSLPNLHLDRADAAHFARYEALGGNRHAFERDRAGVNKLFLGLDSENRLHVGNYLFELLEKGLHFDAIGSVPPGARLEVDLDARRVETHAPARWPIGVLSPREAAVLIRARMLRIFELLSEALAGREIFVSLSGGLDSTIILTLARAHFERVTAVTFALDDGAGGSSSEDLHHAREVAEGLEVPLELVSPRPEVLVEELDAVLRYNQDPRDFNVHCALVNDRLGHAMASLAAPGKGKRPVVLTGDGMNELTADYSPVEYEGRSFYEMPRLRPSQLRRFLVEGLDAGDREVGVFGRHGIQCVQPYLLAAPEYLAVSGEIIDEPEGKQKLARMTWGDRVPESILTRKKVRAQEASSDRASGTLAALVDRGIDQATLRERFGQLLGLGAQDLDRLVQRGRYRPFDQGRLEGWSTKRS